MFEHSFKREALTESTKYQSLTGGNIEKITTAVASVGVLLCVRAYGLYLILF